MLRDLLLNELFGPPEQGCGDSGHRYALGMDSYHFGDTPEIDTRRDDVLGTAWPDTRTHVQSFSMEKRHSLCILFNIRAVVVLANVCDAPYQHICPV